MLDYRFTWTRNIVVSQDAVGLGDSYQKKIFLKRPILRFNTIRIFFFANTSNVLDFNVDRIRLDVLRAKISSFLCHHNYAAAVEHAVHCFWNTTDS